MPTRAEYVRYLRSLEGGYGPARGLANNDNFLNTWYYGRRVSGNDYAWCLVTECYAQNHFDILAANGGKAAGCPSMKARAERVGAKVVIRPKSTKDMEPGDPLAYDFNHTDEPEHTGTFVAAISSTEFYATEGNTSTSQYSDAIALKRRSVHDVLWHIELLGVDTTTPAEDVLKTVVDMGATKPQTIKAGKRGSLEFELEYLDPTKVHTDADMAKKGKRYPSVFPKGADAPYAVTAEVVLAGRPAPGVELTIASYKHDVDEFERDIRGTEIVGDRVTLHSNIRMSDQHRYRADVLNTSTQDVVVKSAYLFIAH